LLERRVPAAKISVIPNGVDVAAFQPQPPDRELREQWNGAGKFVCAYIGTIGMAHGLEVVLTAAQKLRDDGREDVQFWIVGDGAERARLQQQATEQRLDNITFTGMIPKSQVDRVLASCDACLVHLRGTELFGTVIPSKVFETMAMNVPIIMGVKGQAQDIVLNGQGGVPMTPDDADSLLECLDAVARDPMEYSRGRDYVARHFHRDELAARLLEIVAAIADGKPPHAPLKSEIVKTPAKAA
ncbi:MAG: glycosyltransferase family 4 protein, partial [Planctomycetaceae bacterium]|nr:glycosyltransferase family 4 protein [Planctomycetaceae bacterium]